MARDATVPFLTVEEADDVRRLAADAIAAAGLGVTVGPDHVVASNGWTYGLWNVAATCHQAAGGRKDWPAIVAHHVAIMLTPAPSLADLDESELLDHLVLRVQGSRAVPRSDCYTYLRPLADDLVEGLAFDTPTTVILLSDADVARLDLPSARRTALEHLLHEPIDAVLPVQARDGLATFHVVVGDSVYTASRILAMRDLLRRVYGEREFPDGALVAVAHRHQVAVHAVDGPEVLHAANAMAVFAKVGHDEAPGGISPHLYWWHEDSFTRVSGIDVDGRTTIEPGAELSRVLERLLRRGT